MTCGNARKPLRRVQNERGLDTTCRLQLRLLVQGQYRLEFHAKWRNVLRIVGKFTNDNAGSFLC